MVACFTLLCLFSGYWAITFTATGLIAAHRRLGEQQRIWRAAFASPACLLLAFGLILLVDLLQWQGGAMAWLALFIVGVAGITPLVAIGLATFTHDIDARRGFPVQPPDR